MKDLLAEPRKVEGDRRRREIRTSKDEGNLHLRYGYQLGQRKAHSLYEGEKFAPQPKSDQDHEVSFRALLG